MKTTKNHNIHIQCKSAGNQQCFGKCRNNLDVAEKNTVYTQAQACEQ